MKGLLTEAWKEWNDDNAPRLGAALAYYTILSIAPLLVIVIAIAGLVFGREAAQREIYAQIPGLVGDQGARAIQTMMLAPVTSVTVSSRSSSGCSRSFWRDDDGDRTSQRDQIPLRLRQMNHNRNRFSAGRYRFHLDGINNNVVIGRNLGRQFIRPLPRNELQSRVGSSWRQALCSQGQRDRLSSGSIGFQSAASSNRGTTSSARAM
jgi:hypothetical protein